MRRLVPIHSMPLAWAVGLAIAGMYLGWTSRAWPHDAQPTATKPLGWKYPFSCCSGFDCREVPPAFIEEGAAGYTIVPTGEVVPYSGDDRLKNSPDGQFHWCSVAGLDDSRTICLFAPPRGF